MSLYQRVGYIKPSGFQEVLPQSTGGGPLGSSLFVTPREFTYNTYAGPGVYSVQDEGLLAFLAYDGAPYWNPSAPYQDGGFRIVTKADGTMSLLPFMQAMAALTIYGTIDEGYNLATLQSAVRFRSLEMRCGPISDFVLGCAAQVGITARRVRALTAGTPNNFDDGHVMVEALDENGDWKLFDIPGDAQYSDVIDTLSLMGIADTGMPNCTPVQLAITGRTNSSSTIPAIPLYDMLFANPADVQNWRNRIYQIFGWDHPNGEVWWYLPPGTEGRASWVLGLQSNFRVKTKSEILSAFY